MRHWKVILLSFGMGVVFGGLLVIAVLGQAPDGHDQGADSLQADSTPSSSSATSPDLPIGNTSGTSGESNEEDNEAPSQDAEEPIEPKAEHDDEEVKPVDPAEEAFDVDESTIDIEHVDAISVGFGADPVRELMEIIADSELPLDVRVRALQRLHSSDVHRDQAHFRMATGKHILEAINSVSLETDEVVHDRLLLPLLTKQSDGSMMKGGLPIFGGAPASPHEVTRELSDIMIDHLENSDSEARRASIARVFRDVRHDRATETPALMRAAMRDSSAQVRALACYTLGRIGDKSTVNSLQQIAETDPDPDVREEAIDAIDRIENRSNQSRFD